jgi:hypothetical protein
MSYLFHNEVCLNEDELEDLKERCDYCVGGKQDVFIKMKGDDILGVVIVCDGEPAYVAYTKGMSETIREVKQYD